MNHSSTTLNESIRGISVDQIDKLKERVNYYHDAMLHALTYQEEVHCQKMIEELRAKIRRMKERR